MSTKAVAAGLQARRRRAPRARLRRQRIFQGRLVSHGGRGQDASPRRSTRNSLFKLASAYPIVSIEDGMAEDDWEDGNC